MIMIYLFMFCLCTSLQLYNYAHKNTYYIYMCVSNYICMTKQTVINAKYKRKKNEENKGKDSSM